MVHCTKYAIIASQFVTFFREDDDSENSVVALWNEQQRNREIFDKHETCIFFVKLSEKRQICKGAVSLICQPIFENLDVQLIVETREMQWNWLQINVSIKKDFHFFPFLCELWWGEKKKNWLSESKILFLQILFHYKFNRMNIASHDDPSLRCNNFDLFLENHVRGCFDSCKKIRKTYWWKYFWHISSFFLGNAFWVSLTM